MSIAVLTAQEVIGTGVERFHLQANDEHLEKETISFNDAPGTYFIGKKGNKPMWLSLPATPDLGRGEHAPAATHVAEGTLSGTLGSAALDTRDTRYSASSTPRFGRGLLDGRGQEQRHGERYRAQGGGGKELRY